MSKWEDQVKVSLDDIFDNESDGIDTNEEEVDEEDEEDEEDGEYTQSDHFTDVEVEDIVSRGLILILAEQYHGETGKKPIWKDKITNVYKKWMEENYPEEEEEEDTSKGKKKMSGSELSKVMEYFHHIKFLYELMSDKMDFNLENIPTEDEIQQITKIKKLVKGE